MEIYLMFISSVNFESRYPYRSSTRVEHIFISMYMHSTSRASDIKTISSPKNTARGMNNKFFHLYGMSFRNEFKGKTVNVTGF